MLLLKVAVSVAAIWYVWYLLYKDDDGDGRRIDVLFHLPEDGYFITAIAIALVFLNLGLEATKWRVLIKEVYPNINWSLAIRAVLAGMTTGLFTPNRIGEYAGRVLMLEPGKRLEALLMTFLDRIAQMFVTLILGTAVGLSWLYSREDEIREYMLDSSGQYTAVIVVVCLVLIGVSVLAFYPALAGKLLASLPFRNKWLRRMSTSLKQIRPALMRKVLAIAGLRYAVFTTQYVLLVYAFAGSHFIIDAYAACMLVLLIKSLIPFIGFSEIGVRESTAMHVMDWINVAKIPAFQSTLFLYLINVLLPSLIGVFFLIQARLNNKRQG